MIKWLKERTKHEKWMLAMIVVLIIGIVVRWGFIRSEAGEAFKSRIEHFKKHDAPAPAADSLPEADSAGWNVVRDSVTL